MTDVSGIYFWELRVISARCVHIINGYLKFRSEPRSGFGIHRWANASSRMHVIYDIQATRSMTNANESKTSSRGNDRVVRFRSRRSRWRKKRGDGIYVSATFTSLPSSPRLLLSLPYTGRKRGTANSTWPCARTVPSRVAYESLHFFLRPLRHRAAATFLIRGPWQAPLVKAEGQACQIPLVIECSYDTLI